MRNLSVFLLVFVLFPSYGQEINCSVDIIAPKLQSNPANKEILTSLKTSVYEFINNTKWSDYTGTTDQFKAHERIEASILINISEKVSSDQFSASIQVSSSRPIFNSSYKSRLFNYNDPNLSLNYLRNTAIIFQPDRHFNNLADVLAFYAFMILGLDYDSFSFEGGTPYFNKAIQIVNNCQNAGERGWKPSEGSQNRFHLIQNTLQPLYGPMRACYYNYHRNGLDLAYEDRNKSLTGISTALNGLMAIHKARPNSFNMQLFFTAKADEVVKVFTPAEPGQRMKMYNLVRQLDPSNIMKYNRMKAGKK